MSAPTPAHPRFFRYLRMLLVSVIAIAVVGIELALLVYEYWSMRPFVYVASTGFVLLSVLSARHGRIQGPAMVIGMAFCWVGDVVGMTDFITSVLAFFAAHVAFLVAFLSLRPAARAMAWTIPGWVTVSLLIAWWLFPHVDPGYKLPVLAYMIIITLMAATATATYVRNQNMLVLCGAIVFFVSDIFVARWRFVSSDVLNPLGTYPLYYAACVMLALSPLTGRRDATRPGTQTPRE